IREVIQQARENGAYYCAPKELAMAESHADFAWAELDSGEYFKARDEVKIADENAKLAYEMSPSAKCSRKAKPAPTPLDTDGDGILDKDDKCPTEPED